MSTTPVIKDYMSEFPHTIGDDISLERAHEKMHELQCHHLPVLHGGKLVGVLSERDLSVARSFADAAETPVEEAMTPDPYLVAPDTPLREVAETMMAKKIGSVVVGDGDQKPLGIFTVTDALSALVKHL